MAMQVNPDLYTVVDQMLQFDDAHLETLFQKNEIGENPFHLYFQNRNRNLIWAKDDIEMHKKDLKLNELEILKKNDYLEYHNDQKQLLQKWIKKDEKIVKEIKNRDKEFIQNITKNLNDKVLEKFLEKNAQGEARLTSP